MPRLSPRASLLLVFAAGVLVFMPAIRSPFFLDDFLHAAMVDGEFPVPRSPFNLYDFVSDADRHILQGRGLLPWWTSADLKIRFFRPLASGLLWLEHRTLGNASALPHHLHSLAWWAAAVLAVRALFARFFSERVTLFATIVFALSPCHSLPLSWLANREALVSLAFGAVALGSHVRFREGQGIVHAAVACVFFLLALLGGGEYALAFGGYVLALELVHRERSVASRMLGVLTFALPAAGYLAVRAMLKYGTAGSGFYTDPLQEPAAFAKAVPYRVVAQLADSWLTFGTVNWTGTGERLSIGLMVILAGALLVLPVRRTLAALEGARRTQATWLLVGSFIALVPTLAVVPAYRLVGIAMIGISAIVALLLDRVWFGPDLEAGIVGQLDSLAAILLGFCQLVHGPGMSFLASNQHRKDALEFVSHAAWVRDHVGAPASAEINVLSGLGPTFFYPFALEPRATNRLPKQWSVLAQAGHVLALRIDERTLDLTFARDRGAYPMGERNLYRKAENPIPTGTELRAPGMTVTVLEATEVGPRRVRFTFDRDPTTMPWIADGLKGAVPVTLPAPGFGAPFDL